MVSAPQPPPSSHRSHSDGREGLRDANSVASLVDLRPLRRVRGASAGRQARVHSRGLVQGHHGQHARPVARRRQGGVHRHDSSRSRESPALRSLGRGDDRRRRRQRYTSPAFESTNPSFSDDGKILYFTSQRPGGGRGTTWALRMDQPAGEAYQPAGQPQIRAGSSPADMSFTDHDNRPAAVAAVDAAVVVAGAEARRLIRPPPTPRPPTIHMDGCSRSRGRRTTPSRIRKIRRATTAGTSSTCCTRRTDSRNSSPVAAPRRPEHARAPRRSTSSAPARRVSSVTKTNYSHRDATVSPDGKWIAFLADASLRSDSAVRAETRFDRQAAAGPQARRSGAQRHGDLHPSRRGVRASDRRVHAAQARVRGQRDADSSGRRTASASRSSASRAATRISGCSS